MFHLPLSISIISEKMEKMTVLLFICTLLFQTLLGSDDEEYCDETAECAGQTLDDDFIYCWGYKACALSTIDNEFVECNGYAGCYGATMTVSGDTYCRSSQSCACTELDISGTAYCGGYYGCAGSSSFEALGGIHCTGESACRYSHISSDSGVMCEGDEGCWFSKITKTSSVTSSGYYSAMYVDIDTTGVDDFTMLLNGYMAGYNGQISCAQNSTCKIKCQQPTSCYDLVLYCYGSCNVDCEGKDYDCPLEIDYSVSTSKVEKQYASLRQSREKLRVSHQKEFSLLLDELNDKSDKINREEKELKMFKFNEKVENDMAKWKVNFEEINKFNKYNINNNKKYNIIKPIKSSSSSTSLSFKSYLNENVLLAASLIINGIFMFMFVFKNTNNKNGEQGYELLK